MPIQNFAGTAISNTYQRVVQTDGTYLADGTGSILNILNITASYALNASGSGGGGVSFPYSGSAQITGSLGITGSNFITGSYQFNATQDNAFIATVSGSRTAADIAFNFRKVGETAGTRHTMIVEGTGGNDTNRYFEVRQFGTTSGIFTVKGNGSVNINMPNQAANYGGLSVGGWNTGFPSLNVRGPGTTSATTALRVENSNTSASLVVLDNGFVGINTGSAQYNLDVNGTLRASSNITVGDVLLLGNEGKIAGTNGAGMQLVAAIGGTVSQNVRITQGLSTVTAIASAILQVDSTTKGFLPPRTNLLSNISNPAQGLIVYLTSSANEGLYYYNSGSYQGWTKVLNNSGSQNITGSLIILGSAGTGSALTVYKSGSTVMSIQGSQGELFSITDSLSGSLFSVSNISGLPVLETFSDNTTLLGNYQAPALFTTQIVTANSGSTVIYSLPTASYDGAFFDYTIRSGSNARAGSIMAIWSGTSVNYTDNSTTDFGTTTGFLFSVIVSGSNLVLTGSVATSGWTVKTIIRSI